MKIKGYAGSLSGHFGYEKYLMEDNTIIVVNEAGGNGETYEAWVLGKEDEPSFSVRPIYIHEDGKYILKGWEY